MAEAKVRIRWRNRLEKFASDEDRAQGKEQEIVQWENEDTVPQDVARFLGFDIDNQQEVTEHGTDKHG
jgi:hypothetical protein